MAFVPWFVGFTAFFGLLIGSFLNVVVWRVPRGESIVVASHCPNCDAPVKPWQNVPVISWLALRGRCANCGTRISVRYPLVEIGTALAFGLVAWWYASNFSYPSGMPAGAAWWLAFAAFLWLAGASIALVLIDLEHQRLPDAIVLPSIGMVGVLLALAAVFSADWPRLIGVVGAAALLFVLYLLIALIYPKGIGGGDVKLAPLTGAALGYIGWAAVAVGAFGAFILGAIVGLGLIAVRRATRKTGIPFGPFMLLGCWIGAVWGESLMGAYLQAFGL